MIKDTGALVANPVLDLSGKKKMKEPADGLVKVRSNAVSTPL